MLKRWKDWMVGALVAAASAGSLAAALPAGYAPESYDAALAGARQSGKPILLYFTQGRCGYCQNVAKLLESDELRAAFAPNYHLVVVNIDKDRRSEPFQQSMIGRFKIGVAPTFVFLNSEGRYLCTSYGAFFRASEGLALHRFVQSAKDDSGALVIPSHRQCGRA